MLAPAVVIAWRANSALDARNMMRTRRHARPASRNATRREERTADFRACALVHTLCRPLLRFSSNLEPDPELRIAPSC